MLLCMQVGKMRIIHLGLISFGSYRTVMEQKKLKFGPQKSHLATLSTVLWFGYLEDPVAESVSFKFLTMKLALVSASSINSIDNPTDVLN